MLEFTGVIASTGIAVGKIVELENQKTVYEKISIENIEQELKRFEDAWTKARNQLTKMHQKATEIVGEDEAAVFMVHQMLLEDQRFLESVRKMITDEKVCAEYAVFRTGEQLAGIFEAMDDGYMKTRSTDIKDLTKRVTDLLSGHIATGDFLAEPCVIVADDLTPSETIQFDKSKVLAFVMRQGSQQSHTAILARTMGIPTLVGVPAPKCLNNRMGIVDGMKGVLFVQEEYESEKMTGEWEKLLIQYKEQQREETGKQQLLQRLKGKTVVNRQGKQMKLCANIDCINDIEAVLANDADGIGLFRSEFLYLKATDYPSEEEQFEVYKTVVERMNGRPVVVRTLDIGADKQIGYFNLAHEDNPALGYRAIRISLTREDIFRTQLRALYRASTYGKLAIMFPMITSLWEVKRAKEIAHEVQSVLRAERVQIGDPQIGIMIETPAAVMMSEELAREVDFFSIGTNDLTQYTLAVDRQNRNLERFYDAHHPAVLRMIRMTIENSHKAGIRTGICGELAADLSLSQTFLEMGVDELSMSPAAILEVKHKLLEPMGEK